MYTLPSRSRLNLNFHLNATDYISFVQKGNQLQHGRGRARPRFNSHVLVTHARPIDKTQNILSPKHHPHADIRRTSVS